MNSTTRRRLFRSLFLGAPTAGIAYGSAVEKRWLSVTRKEIALSSRHAAADGLTVGVMADFHHDDFGDNALIRRAVETLNEAGVDLVLLAGDYISEDPTALDPLCHELRHLRPKLGTFAVAGNHDRWHTDANFLADRMAQAGVHFLRNEIAGFEPITVAGLDSIWGGQPDLPGVLARSPKGKPILLGWHEPDTFRLYQDERVALQVSGHTHGGQVCAPIRGPILLPRYGKIFPYGLYRERGSHLFVTRGIGTLSIPARFCCPPEVAILRMKADESIG